MAAADKPNKLMTNKLMPTLRYRHDGFTPDRTRVFLATLGQRGCVRDAARVAGVTSTNAYRLKARFPLFSAEWDRALARATVGLQAIAWQRAVEGKETIIIRKGEEVERRITPDSSILGLLLKQGKMRGEGGEIDMRVLDGSDAVITRTEYAAGWRFNSDGEKINMDEDADVIRQDLLDRLNVMRRRIDAVKGMGS